MFRNQFLSTAFFHENAMKCIGSNSMISKTLNQLNSRTFGSLSIAQRGSLQNQSTPFFSSNRLRREWNANRYFSTSSYNLSSSSVNPSSNSSNYDVVIIGGGHNGLVCANYLAMSGKKVLVLERRHIVGGAAVTEELYPGFKFSRASYLCSLLRPQIIKDLDLHRHGLEFLERRPASFTPMKDGSYLMLGVSREADHKEISKFSKEDADNYLKYQEFLERYASALESLVDNPPFDPQAKPVIMRNFDSLKTLMKEAVDIGISEMPDLTDVLLAPAAKILKKWFNSEPLKATLATDAVIGEFASPETPGSAYVLLHHVFNDLGFGRGVWAYVKGGMGSITQALAKSALEKGVEIRTNQIVSSIIIGKGKKAEGIVLSDGSEIKSKIVVSACDPDKTFLRFVNDKYPDVLPEKFRKRIESINYNSATFKINLAVDKLPNFTCYPNSQDGKPGPQHYGTIHFEEHIDEIHSSYSQSYLTNLPSKRPIIEMTIPSSLDKTLAPEGKHVVQLFTQYAPYHLPKGSSWDDPGRKEEYAQSVYNVIEEYAPGFKSSILYQDLLSPLDLERTFSLKGGNIFHGSIALDQLYWQRPASGFSRHDTPIDNYFLAGSGSHPGGGVMGGPGRNCANVILNWHKL